MNSYSVEYEMIKEMYDIDDVIKLKIYAVNGEDYELAASARDQENFLNSPEGYSLVREYKRKQLEKKLKRVLKNDNTRRIR